VPNVPQISVVKPLIYETKKQIHRNYETMTKEDVNLKVIKELNNKGYDAINMDFNLLNDFADILYEAINYTQCCVGEKSLPNIYEGTLNNDRIKIIRTLSDNYNVSIDTIRGLFNDGADFYKQTLTK